MNTLIRCFSLLFRRFIDISSAFVFGHCASRPSQKLLIGWGMYFLYILCVMVWICVCIFPVCLYRSTYYNSLTGVRCTYPSQRHSVNWHLFVIDYLGYPNILTKIFTTIRYYTEFYTYWHQSHHLFIFLEPFIRDPLVK